MNAKEKHVYLFSELDQAEAYAKDGWDSVRGLLGGKGANLADMTRLGVPVPPGLTVTTESCNAFLEAGEEFPEGMWDQVLEGLKAVEAQMGRNFGDLQDPLVLSFGCQILDAGDDGHGAQHRTQRRSGRADDTPDQRAFRL